MARPTRIKNKLIAQNSVELPQLTPSTAITLDANKNIVSSSVTAAELANVSGTTSPIQEQIDAEKEKIDDHIADSTNPHSVTKDQVGLGNVDNTSDLDKPVSTAIQDALNLKYDASNPSNFVDATGAAAAAPVQSVAGKAGDVLLDKSDVGLSNVDNTSDLDKPISTATQTALNAKQDSLGFTPENVANKSVDTNLGTSDTLYPSQNAVKTYVDNSIASATVPDATSTTKGILKLTGDLSGTADSPTVPGLANKANITHTHALSDLTQSSASTGQVVTWNGTNWVPATPDAVITDHTQLSNIGTNTHAQIDSHISAVSDVHGIGPANSVVGTGTSQSLTNKTIDADLNTISNIDNADIKAGAAIDRTKLAAGHSYRVVTNNDLGVMTDAAAITPARALISDANGIPTHSTVSSTTLTFLDATSSIQTQLDGKIDESREGQPNGIATLDGSGKIPSTQLPSYVDDVLEFADFASFPATGETGKIYVALDTNITYRWSGSSYIQITSGAVASVNGQTGVVVLTKSDVGLSNVDNTSDLNKPISTATQLALDGKADISHTQALSTITQSGASTGQVPIWNGSAWVPGVPAGTATWGGISGVLSNQTDLQSALDAKFDDPTGTTSQYIRGDGSLATFPTSINQANSLVTTVFNKSGAPIPKFSVVYISGGQGDLPTIALAQANAESSSSKTYGVVYADIPNMQSGQVIVAGALTGLNTDQFNPTAPVGDVNGTALYLSPTVPGGLTTTKPYAPDHMVYVATIVRTHQNEGVVEVRIQNGFELQELHNVQILNGSEQNNQVLKYDSATSLWKNKYIGLASDIEETSFAGANNQSSFANVTGLAFSAASVRSVQVVASVYVNATTPLYQAVEMSIINKGGSFAMSVNGTGDNSGVTFDITNSGQVQYTSSNYTGFVSLTIKFRALTTSI